MINRIEAIFQCSMDQEFDRHYEMIKEYHPIPLIPSYLGGAEVPQEIHHHNDTHYHIAAPVATHTTPVPRSPVRVEHLSHDVRIVQRPEHAAFKEHPEWHPEHTEFKHEHLNHPDHPWHLDIKPWRDESNVWHQEHRIWQDEEGIWWDSEGRWRDEGGFWHFGHPMPILAPVEHHGFFDRVLEHVIAHTVEKAADEVARKVED